MKSIIINIISSIIFQIILIAASGSGIIYTLRKVFRSLHDNSVTISIFTLILLTVSWVAITVGLILLFKYIHKRSNKKKDSNFGDVEDYYFSHYEKHITIYQNGNGIIIHKFKIIANDVNKLQIIRRKINIEDGVKTSNFPSLDTMLHNNKANRFQEFGFWYKSDNDIISNVEEYYWDRKTLNENNKIKNNPQELRWIFKIDKNKLKRKKPYEICYVISVPGLAALQNGCLNKEWLNDPSEENSRSNIHIDHKIQKLKYIISFEDGIGIDTPPNCKCVVSEQDGLKTLDILGKEEYDLLYRKYIFEVENPIFGSTINISWKYNEVD